MSSLSKIFATLGLALAGTAYADPGTCVRLLVELRHPAQLAKTASFANAIAQAFANPGARPAFEKKARDRRGRASTVRRAIDVFEDAVLYVLEAHPGDFSRQTSELAALLAVPPEAAAVVLAFYDFRELAPELEEPAVRSRLARWAGEFFPIAVPRPDVSLASGARRWLFERSDTVRRVRAHLEGNAPPSSRFPVDTAAIVDVLAYVRAIRAADTNPAVRGSDWVELHRPRLLGLWGYFVERELLRRREWRGLLVPGTLVRVGGRRHADGWVVSLESESGRPVLVLEGLVEAKASIVGVERALFQKLDDVRRLVVAAHAVEIGDVPIDPARIRVRTRQGPVPLTELRDRYLPRLLESSAAAVVARLYEESLPEDFFRIVVPDDEERQELRERYLAFLQHHFRDRVSEADLETAMPLRPLSPGFVAGGAGVVTPSRGIWTRVLEESVVDVFLDEATGARAFWSHRYRSEFAGASFNADTPGFFRGLAARVVPPGAPASPTAKDLEAVLASMAPSAGSNSRTGGHRKAAREVAEALRLVGRLFVERYPRYRGIVEPDELVTAEGSKRFWDALRRECGIVGDDTIATFRSADGGRAFWSDPARSVFVGASFNQKTRDYFTALLGWLPLAPTTPETAAKIASFREHVAGMSQTSGQRSGAPAERHYRAASQEVIRALSLLGEIVEDVVPGARGRFSADGVAGKSWSEALWQALVLASGAPPPEDVRRWSEDGGAMDFWNDRVKSRIVGKNYSNETPEFFGWLLEGIPAEGEADPGALRVRKALEEMSSAAGIRASAPGREGHGKNVRSILLVTRRLAELAKARLPGEAETLDPAKTWSAEEAEKLWSVLLRARGDFTESDVDRFLTDGAVDRWCSRERSFFVGKSLTENTPEYFLTLLGWLPAREGEQKRRERFRELVRQMPAGLGGKLRDDRGDGGVSARYAFLRVLRLLAEIAGTRTDVHTLEGSEALWDFLRARKPVL